MKKPPAFQLFAADFFMDTVEWTVEEVGIYWRLLEAQWVNGSIPNDPVRLARIAGCGPKKFSSGWKIVKSKFNLNGDGRLQNQRLEETREEQRKYREAQSESGKLGAQKRWEKGSKPIGDAIGNPNDETMALQSSSNKKEKDIQAALVFPLRDNKEFPLTLAKISEYEKTYRNIDVSFELKKCLQWNIDNKDKRKTERGILKHINQWLNEASKSQGAQPAAGIERDSKAADEARRDTEEMTPERKAEAKKRLEGLADMVGKKV